jgi:hypothetical protein
MLNSVKFKFFHEIVRKTLWVEPPQNIQQVMGIRSVYSGHVPDGDAARML